MRRDQKMVDLLCSFGAARRVHLLAHYNDLQTAAAVFAANAALADDPGALGSAASHEGFVRLMLRYQPGLPKRVAVSGRTREITELLFQHGMNANHSDWLRITPLHRFAEKGDLENAAIFIDHGADLNACDEEFRSTPLGYAARCGKVRMVEFLLRRGAKPEMPDDPPWARPLSWATRRGHEQIVRLLRQYQEDGKLPPEPSLEEFESLARDLVEACNSGDLAAAQRVIDHYQIDPRTWNTGDSRADAVRRRVRELLGRRPDPEHISDSLAPADARHLIARMAGFAGWAELAKQAGG
jgi:ankyrin repeat protein